MRSLWILLFSVCAVFACCKDDRLKWREFKIKFGKTYSHRQEDKFRFSIFRKTLKAVEEHNAQYEAGTKTFKKALNYFADMTKEEYCSLLKHQRSNISDLGITLNANNGANGVKVEVPASIDWREKGAVSPVKNQGACGACWAFSVTGVLESFWYLQNKTMLSFSEQQMLDCSGMTCNGGDEGPALKYVQENGIQSEQNYPYKARQLSCSHNKSASVLQIKGYVQLPRGDEDALLTSVGTLGPISVALDATDLQQYQSGVFSSSTCSKDSTNHAVLAVGYGKDPKTGEDYWILKNSWGPDWGDEGFFKMRRGTNECAISVDNVYPVFF